MPFIPNTPESFIQRSDSKDPAATCSGLAQSGRPCRRPIAGSPRPSKSPPPSNSPPELGYCWQHQDQADHNASPQGLQKSTIRERTSIDTLVDRLGLLEVESPVKASSKRRRTHSAAPAVQSTTTHGQSQNTQTSEKPSHRPRPKPAPKKTWSLLCCLFSDVADEEQGPRPSEKRQEKKTSSAVPNISNNGAKLSPNSATRPAVRRDPPSRTAEFLSLIPSEVSPETTALLLTELAKPTSAQDEPGFIYIFWLTSENLPNKPPPDATSSLLAPPADPARPEAGRRRTSDVLQSFSTDLPTPRSNQAKRPTISTEKKPILLKIGRANNVQRRMNEWQRQCGYEVTLIRFYPYVDITSPSPSTNNSPSRGSRPSLSQSNTPRKVPNAHKVERLIHLELTGRGRRAAIGGKCERCGKTHREWFQIEGSRSGLREVDEVIRRWVEWGERESRVD